MELVFTSPATAAITIFCSFPGVTRRAIKYDNKQSNSSSAANARRGAGEGLGACGCPPCIPLGTQGTDGPSGRALGMLRSLHRAQALEVCRDGAAWPLAPEQGELAPLCSSRYGIPAPSGEQLQEMEIPQSWHQHPSLAEPAHGWPPRRPRMEPGPRAIGPEGSSKPGARLQELPGHPPCCN